MKRIVSFLCVVYLLVGFTACGNAPGDSIDSTSECSTATTSGSATGTKTEGNTTTTPSGSGDTTVLTTGTGKSSTAMTPSDPENRTTMTTTMTKTTTTKTTMKTGFSVTKPKPSVTEGEMIDLALNVYQDLLDNWWTGSAKTGHLVPTYHGKSSSTMDGIWEHAMAAFALDTLYRATGLDEIHNRIAAEWEFIKETTSNFVRPAYGRMSWQDDAGWAAMLYMLAYKHTGDVFALNSAGELIRNCYAYWADGDLATNGLFYLETFEKDTVNRHNSLHAVSLLTASFDYLTYRDDPQIEKDSMAVYNWVEEHMLRDGEFSYINRNKQNKTGFCDDNLYWFNFNQQRATADEYTGPEHATTPYKMNEGAGQSSVFLGGVIGMAGVHAQLYERTGEKKYLERAQRTLRAVNDSEYLVKNGVYVNAGDAWTNASFMYFWVTRVMTLPGLQKKDVLILNNTANSIYNNARTNDGYYSGSWSGPAEDANTPWGKDGWTYDTIMCSATSMHMIFAAALAESMGLG